MTATDTPPPTAPMLTPEALSASPAPTAAPPAPTALPETEVAAPETPAPLAHPPMPQAQPLETKPTPPIESIPTKPEPKTPEQPAPVPAPQGALTPDRPAAPEQRRPRVEKVGPGSEHWVLWDFPIGGSALLPEHAKMLDRLAILLRSAGPGAPLRIHVDGHASHSGSARFNQALAKQRAERTVAHLQAQGIEARAIDVRYLGYERPWYLGETAESSHNRRVEVELTGPLGAVGRLPELGEAAGGPRRDPLPRPLLPGSIQWSTPAPGRPGSGQVADYLPGFSVEGKIPIRIPDVPLGTDWILSPEAELGLKLEFTTKVPATVAMALKSGTWDRQIKWALGREFLVAGSLTEGKVSVQFKKAYLRPEFELGIANLLKDPEPMAGQLRKDPTKLFKVASVKFTIEPLVYESAPVDFGLRIPELAGIAAQLKFTPKVIVSIAPSPVLIGKLGVRLAAHLGPGAAIAGTAVVLTGALTLLTLYLISEARKRGQHWGEVINFRRGYAWRLAAEAADWRTGRGIVESRSWDRAREEILRARFQGVARSELEREWAAITEQTYSEGDDGWQAADVMLKRLSAEQYEAAMLMLRSRFGGDAATLESEIFWRIGGHSKDDIALPADPTLLE
ncbi:MAG: OmpA family protein [Rhodospirillales bacterium]|nr:OmpA family protein [Rhodospirillales bacterium]